MGVHSAGQDAHTYLARLFVIVFPSSAKHALKGLVLLPASHLEEGNQ